MTHHDKNSETPGGLPPEKVENRENVGQANPKDYPDPAKLDEPKGPGQSVDNYAPKGTSTGAAKDPEAPNADFDH